MGYSQGHVGVYYSLLLGETPRGRDVGEEEAPFFLRCSFVLFLECCVAVKRSRNVYFLARLTFTAPSKLLNMLNVLSSNCGTVFRLKICTSDGHA